MAPARGIDRSRHHARTYAENNSALLHVLEAYIETLKAENESLKRQLAARERCPWWCRRIRAPDDPAHREVRREKRA